jgi:tryptophan synthase alpha chain
VSRLKSRFDELANQKKKAFLAYIVAGDPEPDVTVNLMHEMVGGGVSAIELGVPFSDPEAEGPVIQLAHERALAHNTSLSDSLDMVAEFREKDAVTPIILMGYLNPIETMGYGRFAERAAQAGVDAMIIVNLPPEEAGDLGLLLSKNDIDLVYLLAPTTTDDRARMICQASSGFVYYVSLKGTTGAGSLDIDDVREKMERFRAFSSLPVLVGFGIKDGETAASVAAVSDGVVVGSAIVKLMDTQQTQKANINSAVLELVSEIRHALDDTSDA